MIRPWKVLESKTTFKDRWLTLRTDRCETDSGKILENYHVVEYPNWINVLGITKNLDAITVFEYRHGAGMVVQGLPAGTIDKSDDSPEICARREMEEETGFTGGNFFHTGTAHPNPATQCNQVYSYLALNLEQNGQTHFDLGENIEVALVPFQKLVRLSFEEVLPFQSLHIAAFHQALMFILRTKDPKLEALQRIARTELRL